MRHALRRWIKSYQTTLQTLKNESFNDLENVITSSTSLSKNTSFINSKTETVSFIPVKLKNAEIIFIIKFHVFINDALIIRSQREERMQFFKNYHHKKIFFNINSNTWGASDVKNFHALKFKSIPFAYQLLTANFSLHIGGIYFLFYTSTHILYAKEDEEGKKESRA